MRRKIPITCFYLNREQLKSWWSFKENQLSFKRQQRLESFKAVELAVIAKHWIEHFDLKSGFFMRIHKLRSFEFQELRNKKKLRRNFQNEHENHWCEENSREKENISKNANKAILNQKTWLCLKSLLAEARLNTAEDSIYLCWTGEKAFQLSSVCIVVVC